MSTLSEKLKGAKTMEQVAQEQYPDPTRKTLFTGVGGERKEVNVMGTDGKVHSLNLDLKESQLSQDVWTKREQDAMNYNDNIYDLDPMYASVEPVHSIIVRCKHIIPNKTESGIYEVVKLPVAEKTMSGIGVREVLDSPWPISTEAVVIAVPKKFELFKPGDTIQITEGCRCAKKISVEHPFELPYGYTHPSFYSITPPGDPKNRHFGYLRIDPYQEVAAVLTRAKSDDDNV